MDNDHEELPNAGDNTGTDGNANLNDQIPTGIQNTPPASQNGVQPDQNVNTGDSTANTGSNASDTNANASGVNAETIAAGIAAGMANINLNAPNSTQQFFTFEQVQVLLAGIQNTLLERIQNNPAPSSSTPEYKIKDLQIREFKEEEILTHKSSFPAWRDMIFLELEKGKHTPFLEDRLGGNQLSYLPDGHLRSLDAGVKSLFRESSDKYVWNYIKNEVSSFDMFKKLEKLFDVNSTKSMMETNKRWNRLHFKVGYSQLQFATRFRALLKDYEELECVFPENYICTNFLNKMAGRTDIDNPLYTFVKNAQALPKHEKKIETVIQMFLDTELGDYGEFLKKSGSSSSTRSSLSSFNARTRKNTHESSSSTSCKYSRPSSFTHDYSGSFVSNYDDDNFEVSHNRSSSELDDEEPRLTRIDPFMIQFERKQLHEDLLFESSSGSELEDDGALNPRNLNREKRQNWIFFNDNNEDNIIMENVLKRKRELSKTDDKKKPNPNSTQKTFSKSPQPGKKEDKSGKKKFKPNKSTNDSANPQGNQSTQASASGNRDPNAPKTLQEKYTVEQMEKLKTMTKEEKARVRCGKCSEYFHRTADCPNPG